jgi:lysophospholipase L1-like esterase
MEKNVCIFGDSIAWGKADTEKGGWANRLKIFFEKEDEDIEVYNLSVSGNITDDVLEKMVTESQMRQANLLIFAIGINDSQYIKAKDNPRTSLDKFKNSLRELIAQSRKFTKEIVFLGFTDIDESKTMPIPWKKDVYYDKENVTIYDQALKSVCEEEKVSYINMKGVIKLEDLADGVHPNSIGHEKIYQRVKDFLIKDWEK